jgi:hypothetical protein
LKHFSPAEIEAVTVPCAGFDHAFFDYLDANHTTTEPRVPVRKTPKTSRRWSITAERKIARNLGVFLDPSPEMTDGCPVIGALTDPITSNVAPLAFPGLDLPAWRYIQEPLLAFSLNAALCRAGKVTYALSLQLSDERIEDALASESCISYLQDKIRYHLGRAMKSIGRPGRFWVILEVSAEGRLHIHGACSGTGEDVLINGKHIPEKTFVEAALRRAGGDWSEGRGKARQALAKLQFRPSGWASYTVKSIAQAKSLAQSRIIGFDMQTREDAESLYSELRAKLNCNATLSCLIADFST